MVESSQSLREKQSSTKHLGRPRIPGSLVIAAALTVVIVVVLHTSRTRAPEPTGPAPA